MPIEIRCRRCGRPFVADRTAILAGRWRLCPACRDPRPPGGGDAGAVAGAIRAHLDGAAWERAGATEAAEAASLRDFFAAWPGVGR